MTKPSIAQTVAPTLALDPKRRAIQVSMGNMPEKENSN